MRTRAWYEAKKSTSRSRSARVMLVAFQTNGSRRRMSARARAWASLATAPWGPVGAIFSSALGANITDNQGVGTISNDETGCGPVTCPASANPGASFATNVSGGSSANDWIALYSLGAPSNPAPSNWRYVPLPRPNTQTFTAPTQVGTYELRLFSNNSFNLIGSCQFPVSNGPSLSINDVTQAEGNAGTSTFTFTVTLSTAGQSSYGEWIAVEYSGLDTTTALDSTGANTATPGTSLSEGPDPPSAVSRSTFKKPRSENPGRRGDRSICEIAPLAPL